jgi:hypothetical protein
MENKSSSNHENKCTHRGFFANGGTSAIPLRDRIWTITTLFCTNCGAVMHSTADIPNPKIEVPTNTKFSLKKQ